MVSVDDYKEVRECVYKEEHYSVRDNGAVMRHSREGLRKRKLDDIWTFGNKNAKSGYMEIAHERVHRIVACAFHGNPPSELLVVDHIDTNRCNNRPENLRWLTRLENVLKNPITRARIENICGSIEAFLENPSVLRGLEHIDSNFYWMRSVSPEEAHVSLERMTKWAKEHPESKGGNLGEWVFQEQKKFAEQYNLPQIQPRFEPKKEVRIERPEEYKSLTPNAVQIKWRTPTEFVCCPSNPKDNPLEEYHANLKKGALFTKNEYYNSLVHDYAISKDGKSLLVISESEGQAIKPWALCKITYSDGVFKHESKGTFFEEKGAEKYFTIEQGKEWTGGHVFDDWC